jgi:PIN domain nuclease of toxin-antitoxin system
MRKVLLDTSPFLWFDSGSPMLTLAIAAIDAAVRANALFVSPISAWEIGVADGKKRIADRPPLQGLLPSVWFERALKTSGAQLAPFNLTAALESARLPPLLGYGDPGDCFLIATAHTQNLTLITRDARIIAFAAENPTYLSVVRC